MMENGKHHGRPGTPTDQAHVESFFSHLKGDWPHLVEIRDPAALDSELARIRGQYNTVRLHAAIGYVTPDDEHHGRGARRFRRAGGPWPLRRVGWSGSAWRCKVSRNGTNARLSRGTGIDSEIA